MSLDKRAGALNNKERICQKTALMCRSFEKIVSAKSIVFFRSIAYNIDEEMRKLDPQKR